MPTPPADRAPPVRLAIAAVGLLAFFLIRAVQLLAAPLDYLDQVGIAAAARAAFVLDLPPYAAGALAAAAGPAVDPARLPPYLYPPPSLLAFAPLALVEPASWEVAASLLNAGLAALCGVLVLRLVPPPERHGGFAALALYLCAGHGAAATIWYGQVNLLVLLALLGVWLSMRAGRDRPVCTGLLVAAAVLVKTYPALFIPYLAARGRWRAAGVCCAALGAVAGASWLVLPAGTWDLWLAEVAPSGGYGRTPRGLFAPLTFSNQSLNGFAMRLFTVNPLFEHLLDAPLAARLVPAAGALALLAAAAATIARSRRRGDPAAIDAEFCMLLALMFVAAPLSWLHHLVFLMPAGALLLGRALAGGAPLPRALAGLAALLLAVPLNPMAFGVRGLPATLLASTTLFVALGVFVWALRRARGTAGPPGTPGVHMEHEPRPCPGAPSSEDRP